MLSNIQLEKLLCLLSINTPTGNEFQIHNYITKYLNDKCTITYDVVGNCYIQVGNPHGLKVLITSHCDEVSFQVTDIDPNGFIYFRKVASPDRHTIPGSKVCLVKKDIELIGVVGKKAPHVMQSEEANSVLDINKLWIDFGFNTKEEVMRYVEIGDYIVPYSQPMLSFDKTKVISKALDNKASVFVVTELLERLSKENIPICVIGAVTVQEEVGCRGAILAANRINPDIAFCLDVGLASDIPTMKSVHEFGKLNLGAGAGINVNPENNVKLTSLLISTAIEHGLDCQKTVGYRAVKGTETSCVQISGAGVATALVSIPERYMHSTVEMCSMQDISQTIDLLYYTIKSLCNKTKEDFIPWDINGVTEKPEKE